MADDPVIKRVKEKKLASRPVVKCDLNVKPIVEEDETSIPEQKEERLVEASEDTPKINLSFSSLFGA